MGAADAYNDYRLPSKLPEFFGSGRPVLLPKSNVGLHTEDGVNCMHLQTGSAEEIAGRLGELFHDPEMRAQIGTGGAAFAREHFSWDLAEDDLWAFYREYAMPTSLPPN